MPSPTVENYIKQIHLLGEREPGGKIPMGHVAKALGVVPGTATTMMKALANAGLVDYAPRGGVELTASGQKLALDVIRRHRLIETFLVEVLDFDWSEVHQEAEQLEHAVSERLLDRIDRYLGHPKGDPHGDPIPSAAGVLAAGSIFSLADCPLNTDLVVERICDQDTDFLNFIAAAGLNPGVNVKVTARNLRAESVQIEIGSGEQLSFGYGAAAKVMVH